MKKVWQGIKLMSGYARKNPRPNSLMNPTGDELNTFYQSFNCHDFKEILDERHVRHDFANFNSDDHFICNEEEVCHEVNLTRYM